MARPIRILHVLGSMGLGGVETWLMDVLRRIDRTQFEFHFLCLKGIPGFHATEIRRLGGTVIAFRPSRIPWFFDRQLLRILRDGQYRVVHSHVFYFSGYVLRVAAKGHVALRVAHSFTVMQDGHASLVRRAYARLMKKWISAYATTGIGNSTATAASLFGPEWQRDPRWRVIYCGIDLAPYAEPDKREVRRQQLGIPAEAQVVGHVGRFNREKNHVFWISVAREIASRQPNVRYLLVGGGPLQREIEELARAYKLTDRIVFAGALNKVQSALRVMDLFLFPSFREGLPQAVIEAQAAGLRCLCSDVVTRETTVIPGAVEYMPLSAGAKAWADLAVDMLGRPHLARDYALETVRASPFTIDRSTQQLAEIYLSSLQPPPSGRLESIRSR